MNEEAAADLLWNTSRQGNFSPDELVGKLNFSEALKVQLRMLEYHKSQGEAQLGWKIGLTSPSVRASFGTSDQPFGYLLVSGLYHSGDVIRIDDMVGECGLEPELCWTLDQDLRGPGASPERARDAVGTVCPGMEINEKRAGKVRDFGLTIANNLTQWGIVIGDSIDPRSKVIDFDEMVVEMSCDGEVRATSISKEVIDDHYVSLAVLANILSTYGQRLEAGQRVITGSYSKHSVVAGQSWKARFDGIGEVSARIK